MCTFAYSAGPGTEPILFEGRVYGRIVPPRGAEKFGWNPVFEVEDADDSYLAVEARGLSGAVLFAVPL